MKVVCRGVWASAILLLLSAGQVARAEAPTTAPSLFDPARHMRVSEVRPGMKGYGLSVFKGSKIERFPVEVLSILRNFNPKSDVVLIRCDDAYLQHTGSIAGMSGSPIYLHDEAGHDRLIGAFAYGWPMAKDPIAGVQPIEYMLGLPGARATSTATTQPAASDGSVRASDSSKAKNDPALRTVWSMRNVALEWRIPHSGRQLELAAGSRSGGLATPALPGNANGLPRLRPLATPLMVSGCSGQAMQALAGSFDSMGLTLLQSGGSSAPPDAPMIGLEPGSVLAVPLLTGDTDMTAVGTCTEVLGDRVWGFGHPFNNEGSVALPMGAGEIQGVVANLQTSFKLGSMSQASGTLTTDGSVGVAGRIGGTPPTIPITFRIQPADGTPEKTYHFQGARHSKFTPLLAGMAFASALTGGSELPQFNTVDYDLQVDFTNGQSLHIVNRSANTNANDIFGNLGIPMTLAAENPFQQVLVQKISGQVRIEAEAHAAQLLDVTVPKSKYRPGETLRAFATFKPFHGSEGVLPITLDLPRDLAAGSYQLVISDSQRFTTDEAQSQPFRFTTENIGDVFSVLKELTGLRDDALYVRLIRQPDGVAVGHTAMQRLPTSRRQILLGGGHSDTTPFISSTVKTIHTDNVMSGSAEFVITIDTSPKVAVGGPRPRNEANPPAAKPEEPKRAAAASATEPSGHVGNDSNP